MQLSFGNCLSMEGRVETRQARDPVAQQVWGAHTEVSSGMGEHSGRPRVMITEGTVILGVTQGKGGRDERPQANL